MPTMITLSLRRLAGLTSLALKRRSSQRLSMGTFGRLGVSDVGALDVERVGIEESSNSELVTDTS